MNGWRSRALVLGAVIAFCGLLLMRFGAGPLVLVLGVLMVVTAALEPIYGRGDGTPKGAHWQPTDERFIDPETGKRVSVWFETQTGERRYVEDPAETPPTT